MFDNSKNVVVSEASLTVIHGNSITYEGQHAEYPTNSRAGIRALKTLHKNIAVGAMHDSKERYDAPKCHPDTRKAVLNNITSWVSDHSKKTSVLWLSAPAGSGKSAVLQQVAKNFHKSGGLAASFFFSRTAAKRKTDTYLIATLASQLATSIPATRPFIAGAIERDPSIFERVLSEQMTRLVVYPLVYASIHPKSGAPWPTLLVIDGLDECDGGMCQADILRVLRTALQQLRSSLPTLYLLVASRPEPAITAVFEDELLGITHRIVLDGSYDPDRDIAVFLRSSFADIYRRRHALFPSTAPLPQPWPPEDVISFLVRKSSGHFIFAATVIRFIDVDRKIPSARLQIILDICDSMDSSKFEANPFALLDQLCSHVLNSSEETERVIAILGAIFYLNNEQSPTLEFVRALLQLKPEDMTMIFWDLHSIVHIPASDKDPIRFYHASLRDFLTDRYRSSNLYVDGSKAHLFLLEQCIQVLSDFHSGSSQERTTLVLPYSRKYWMTHYTHGDTWNPGFLDQVLEKFNPETWLPLEDSADATAFTSWWNDFAPSRSHFHGRCDPGRCSALCVQYTSILDRYLVHHFQKHKNPAAVAALMWLTILGPIDRALMRFGGRELIVQEADWLWVVRNRMRDKIQFFDFLTGFLSSHGRSNNLFLGGAISTTHFAHVCAQSAWRGIMAFGLPYGSENWRMLVYLYDILNLLLSEDAPYTRSSKLSDEAIIQFTQRRLDDLRNIVKFVEATRTEEEVGSFENQVSRWRNTRMGGASSTYFKMTLSGERSLHDEVKTSPSHVNYHIAQPYCTGKKHKKIMTVGRTESDYKTATEPVSARHAREAGLNDVTLTI